jgi:hypothetical protein
MHKLQGSASRLLIAVVLAAFTTIPAFAETPISDPVLGRGASWQAAPVSATDGRDFLLVWVDGRSGYSALYATRVTADGTVLDPDGILVADSVVDSAQRPSVAWTGDSYIVVWQQDGCRFRRIAPDGRIDDTAGRVLSWCQEPRVAALGGAAIVAGSRSSEVEIEVGVIESNGDVRKVDSAFGRPFDIACTRAECRLVWESRGIVSGRRLGRHGERLSIDRVLATDALGPTIAATEERFLVAWRDRTNPGSFSRRIRAQELDADSELGESKFKPFVVIETTTPVLINARTSSSGSGFLVTWTQEREQEEPIDRRHGIRVNYVPYVPPPPLEIRARRIGDGEEERLMIAPSNVAQSEPAVASNGLTHLGAWIEDSPSKIAAVVLHDVARTPIAVTRTARQQSEPYVVSCGDHLLVVWAEEQDGGRYSVLARRFRFSGEPLDARPVVVAQKVDSQHRPAAAFDGHSYLIAWNEEYRVQARRLHRDGTLAAEVFTLGEYDLTQGTPAVVGTDRGFAVLHADRAQLILTRIGAESSVERTAIAESHGLMTGWFDGSYALGWTGTELVPVWSDRTRIQSARLTSAGENLSFVFSLALRDHFPEAPSIACGVTDCIAAWEEYRDGVRTVSIGKWVALPVGEAGYYQTPWTDRYHPTVVRADGEFKVISYGDGLLHVRPVRDGLARAESTLDESRVDYYRDYAVVSTPEGLVTVYSRPVAGPGFGGSRRLFLRRHAQ